MFPLKLRAFYGAQSGVSMLNRLRALALMCLIMALPPVARPDLLV
jgi:hypothetical protein